MSYSYPVNYVSLPKDKVVASRLPGQIRIQVKGSGFELLSYEFMHEEQAISIDLSRAQSLGNGKEFYMDARQSLDTVSKQLGEKIQVVKIYPESFGFRVKDKVYKKVPVKLNALISYAQQFQLNGTVQIYPEFIQISGDSAELEQIKEIETEAQIMRNLDKPVSRMIGLNLPASFKTIDAEIKKVRLSIPVEKYTESSIETGIITENLPRGVTIKTFPEKVKITYQVAISRYKEIKPELFMVRADYLQTGKDNSSKLKLQLVKTPNFVRNARVAPDKVEFILKRY